MLALIHAESNAWDRALEAARCDVYQASGFHEYARGSGEGEPYLVLIREGGRGLAWPYLLRPTKDVPGLEASEATDVTSVYGYPGPVAWGCPPGDPFIGEAWRQVVEVWRDQAVVAAFTRFNPLLDNAALAAQFRLPDAADEPGSPIAPGTPTVSIDCAISDEAAASEYGRVLRQEIAAARRKGLTTTHDTEWAHAGDFVRLYQATMQRRDAADRYQVGREEVNRLRLALRERIHLLVTRLGSTVAAAGLFTEFGGIVQAHLVGTEADLRALSPLKVLLDDARGWAHRRGDQVLHLGGGRGGREDSLFDFKARFSPRRHAFHTGSWVVDPNAYASLVAARNAARSRADRVDETWFPAYRA